MELVLSQSNWYTLSTVCILGIERDRKESESERRCMEGKSRLYYKELDKKYFEYWGRG